MWYILFATAAFILHLIIKVHRHYVNGTKYRAQCEQMLTSLLQEGYDKRQALLKISRARHPELSESTHRKIVDKYQDLDELVPFIYDVLEFRTSLCSIKGGKLTDEWALTLIGQKHVSDKSQSNIEIPAPREEAEREAYALGKK